MKRLIKFLIFGSLLTPFCLNQSVNAWSFGKSDKKNEKKSKNGSKNEKNTNTSKKLDDAKTTDKKEVDINTSSSTTSVAKTEEGENSSTSSPRVEEKTNVTGTAISNANEKDAAVVFTDGSTISKNVVNDELKDLPLDVTSHMPYQQLLQLLSFKLAYKKIIDTKAAELNLINDKNIEESIKSRCKTFASSKYLDEQVEKMMTDDEVKKYYDETWEKHIKGTQEISGILINVSSKAQADRLIKEVKNEEQLNKIVAEYKTNGKEAIATMPLDDYPEGGLPVDISKQIKAKGVNSVVGPFNIQGISTLFFVKSIHLAVKKPFSDEIKTQYKQIGRREFINKYIDKLMTDLKVTVYDLNGKVLDMNANGDKNKNKNNKDKSKKDDKPVDLSKIKDDFVIAKIGDKQTVKITDLYKMYNVTALENELFASMSFQLKVSMEEVIQSAIKLCVQERLIVDEMERSGFMKRSDIVSKIDALEKQQLRRAYFNKTVKITENDARKEFNKYTKMMKESIKDDQEISVKMMLFKTRAEADKKLSSYKEDSKKFSDDFDAAIKNSKPAIDLGYIRKSNPDAGIRTIWEAVKTAGGSTCYGKVINLKGETFGFSGSDFAIVRVGERRPIQLPKFEETSQFFRKVAEKIQAVAIIDKLMEQQVKIIGDIPFSKIKPEERNKILVSIITEDTERADG